MSLNVIFPSDALRAEAQQSMRESLSEAGVTGDAIVTESIHGDVVLFSYRAEDGRICAIGYASTPNLHAVPVIRP